MCRLELTPRNKDRWSREILIMKKSESILFALVYFCCTFMDRPLSQLSQSLNPVLAPLSVSQVKSHQCCDGSRRPRRDEAHRLKRPSTAGHGVLLQGRPEEGEGFNVSTFFCFGSPLTPRHGNMLVEHPLWLTSGCKQCGSYCWVLDQLTPGSNYRG